MEGKKRPPREPEENAFSAVSQDTVDRLSHARTMEEFLSIADHEGVDWDSLPDEWLDAIAQGDVTDLLYRMNRRRRK